MKRMARIVGAIVGLIALSLPLETAAVSAADGSSSAVIIFDDTAHQAQLIIPTPACPASQPDCQWKFFLNEPKLSVDVATVYGTSGTLTIDYPPNFCGVIQADAYVGPPWVAKRGFQHTIEDCTPPPTVTAVTPTTVQPPPPVNSAGATPPTVPGSVSATTVPPPAASADAAPQVSGSVGVPSVASTDATPAQLPFTGANIKPFLFIGLTLVSLGLFLLSSDISRRRLARRLGDFPGQPWGAADGRLKIRKRRSSAR